MDVAPGGHRRARRTIALLIIGLALASIAAVAAYQYATRLPRRFAVVLPGALYRSGAVTPEQLARVHAAYGVGRVLSLLDPDAAESTAERTAAERLGLTWVNVPLRGNGASTATDRERIRAVLVEPNQPPTLVHCAAGVNRTGLVVGMYRLHVQGWSLDEVMTELRSTDFEDGPRHENLRAALREEAELARVQHGSAKLAS
jgi:protein tyrosine phosphatase (PTP) superfamily phosphohydrolase (DUF442 family)